VLYTVTAATVVPLVELAVVDRYSVPRSGLINESRIVAACPAPPTYEWSYTFLALAVRLPGADLVGRTRAMFSTPPPLRLWGDGREHATVAGWRPAAPTRSNCPPALSDRPPLSKL
jgi:hypothetical protein